MQGPTRSLNRKTPRGARASLAALVGILVPAAGPAACADNVEAVHASILTDLSAPRGILDRATSLSLDVREGDVQCAPETGTVSLPNGDGAAKVIAKKDLGADGCPENVKFCGSLSVPKSAKQRVFGAKALSGNDVIATGCVAATIDKDEVPVAIKMFRFVPPNVCGDNVLQPKEQCEPAGGDVCDDSCQTKEIVVSIGSSANGTSTGKPGDKTDAYFVWPQGKGDPGRFLAFFTDHAVPSGGGTTDIGMRALNDTLGPLTAPTALATSIFLPNGGALPPTPSPNQQSLPQAATLGGKYYIVYQDDTNGTIDVNLRVLGASFSAEGGATPITVNGSQAGEPGTQGTPAIAAGKDKLYVVWQDQASGTIVGRSVATSLGDQNQLSAGSGVKSPSVAFTSKGFVVVWASDTGIKLRNLDANGTPSGGESTVNEGGGAADTPRIAALPDGRFAVVWAKDNDIFMQRYDDRGVAIAGDQAGPINDLIADGDQTQPVIAAMSGAGGSYAMAWRDARSGHIRARFAGGSAGFLQNSVNADTTEFQASRVDQHDRTGPAIAAGGSGPYLAIGWEDKSTETPGIVLRRFPMPTQ